MKKIKIFFGFIILLVVVLAGISFFLPDEYTVERSVTIEAKPKVIFPLVNTPSRWPQWTAWTKERDPSLSNTFEGPERGEGAIYRWNGEKLGNGKMEITGSDSKDGIRYNLEFDNAKYLATGSINFTEVGDATLVSWTTTGKISINPIDRYFGLFMDQLMGRDFQEGLGNLKRIAEAQN